MGHFLARAARRPAPSRADVSAYGSVYTYRAHRRTPAQSGWHVDNTLATRESQSADAWLTTARRLSLYEYSNYPRPHRYAKSVEPGTWCPARSRDPETARCFSE